MNSDHSTQSPACLVPLSPSSSPALRLFCFPFAGGSSLSYQSWARRLGSGIGVYGVELPGHGLRTAESPATVFDDIVPLLAKAMQPVLADAPFAFFGHSMGALLAYSLAAALYQGRQPLPKALILSSCAPPHTRMRLRMNSRLSDLELVSQIRELNGTPAEVLENAELLQLILPVLRADLLLLETVSQHSSPPLPCPITAVGGSEDRTVSISDLHGWERYTTSSFRVEELPGGHFYLQAEESRLIEVLQRDL